MDPIARGRTRAADTRVGVRPHQRVHPHKRGQPCSLPGRVHVWTGRWKDAVAMLSISGRVQCGISSSHGAGQIRGNSCLTWLGRAPDRSLGCAQSHLIRPKVTSRIAHRPRLLLAGGKEQCSRARARTAVPNTPRARGMLPSAASVFVVSANHPRMAPISPICYPPR